jgi:glutamyl-tRNA reductase
MEIMVLGLNHKTAPIEIREKLSIPSHKNQSILKDLERRGIFEERLLLSTCNRTEIYGAGESLADCVEGAKRFLSEYSGTDLSVFDDKLYVLKQEESVEHLFSVASGLDSMVLGETEIIGQVKGAYLSAHSGQQTGKVLNALFQRSLRVAKSVRTNTMIGTGRVSIASVAVELSEKIFESLKGIRVMVLGTGDMSTQVAKAMISKGAWSTIVSSHHHERAEMLAVELGGAAVHYNDYENRMGEVDVLIASTLAPTTLVHAEQVRAWMRTRHGKPLFMIDIAVPRNIEASAGCIDNVYLYNVDDLQGIAGRNRAHRESQLEECFSLVRRQTRSFMDWLLKEFH